MLQRLPLGEAVAQATDEGRMRSIRAFCKLLLCVYSTLALLATLIRHSHKARATFPQGKAFLKPSIRLRNLICALFFYLFRVLSSSVL